MEILLQGRKVQSNMFVILFVLFDLYYMVVELLNQKIKYEFGDEIIILKQLG